METLQRTANRGSVSTGPYQIDNSCKFEHDNAESLNKNQVQGTQTTWTFSTWLKRTQLSDTTDSYMHVWAAGSSTSDNGTKFYFRGDSSYPENRLFFYLDNGGTQYLHGATSQSFRDTSAWYHIVWAVDTTQSTASDRSKVYINGELQTLVGVSGAAFTNPPQNSSTRVNDNGGVMYVGAQNVNGGNRFNGYLAETVLIDGSQLAVTDFGEVDSDTGIWIPKDVSGLSFGTRGFYLDYSDASNLGNDADGTTEFTETNISAADQATDTPTNNFCTLNPLYNYAYGNTITEGATKIYGAANNWGGGKATFGLTSGKWYWEIKQLANSNTFMGLQTDGEDNISSGNAQSQNTTVVFYTDGTLQYSNGSESTTSAPNSIVANSIVGFALDLDSSTQTIKVYLNGSLVTAFGSSGTANLSTYNIADKTVFPFVGLYDRTVNMNFGGYTVSSISSAASDEDGHGTFEYAPPSGYFAICTKNLAEYG
jgi:hypothetical protein